MNQKVDLAEVEGLDFVELGDAMEETRQISPVPVYRDSVFGYGEWGR